MSKLTALKKQIAALQVQAERIAKEEASSAIDKVKAIMAEFNLTIEHLTQSVTGKRAAKKTKVKAAPVAKYADPKTGKTWTGFGRAPGWIAGAKNREAFLVDKNGIKAAKPAVKAPAAAKKAAVKAVKAVKAAKKTAKSAGKRVKTEATAAPVSAVKAAATKPAAVKKAASKNLAKPKAVAKKAGRKASATAAAQTSTESPATAA